MIVVVDPDARFRAQLSLELGRGKLAEAQSLAELQRLATEAGAKLSVVCFGPNVEPVDALRVAASVQASAPGVSVLLVVDRLTPEVLHAALRAGVRDVLAASFSAAEIQDAVARAEAFARQLHLVPPVPEEAKRPRRVVTVFSSKGGCGKSVIASNLAILLAQHTGQEVGLVDLDLESGDLSIMLGLLPAWTIYDAAEQSDRLDEETLRGYLTPHASKVQLMAAPLDPSLAGAISPEDVRRVLRTLGEALPYVVVDGPCSFTDQILAALDETDVCVLVASMDVPSIKNMKLALQTFGRLGFGRDRVRLVLTRADSRVGLHLGEVEKTLGTRIDIAVPSSRDVPLSVNQGTPLAMSGRKSPIVAAIVGLVDAVQLPADQSEVRRGLRRRA